jgi:hypothetical protein
MFSIEIKHLQILAESIESSKNWKLRIFDFDGTTYMSPEPNPTRLGNDFVSKLTRDSKHDGYAWWENLHTLDPQFTTDAAIPFNERVVSEIRTQMEDPNVKLILLTGRNIKFLSRIEDILNTKGLRFDSIIGKDSDLATRDFKIRSINELIDKYNSRDVELWDDRRKHAEFFNTELSKNSKLQKHKVHAVMKEPQYLPEELEKVLVDLVVADSSTN